MANDPKDWTDIFVEKLVEVIKRPQDSAALTNLAHVLRRKITELEQEIRDLKAKP